MTIGTLTAPRWGAGTTTERLRAVRPEPAGGPESAPAADNRHDRHDRHDKEDEDK
ncbi:hypothetical protein AB0O01_15645 [Streptomyces sp. NPDC093252]|uniref:hypothetical protein n=1 Tax=Streptomyces sp. NPDC093252 TaxID=3154980 RepID=UPI0034459F5C